VYSSDQTSAGLDREKFDFCALEGAQFGSGGRGFGGWLRKSTGGQFARRFPPRAQYEGGRSRSFEMERRNGPRSSFHDFRPPPARQGWFSSGGYCGSFCGGSFDGRDDLVCANHTLEQMAQHWFYSFGTNPSVESFDHSRVRF
jgi:hypothetical protein